jgi:hypothetical protein
MGWCTSIRRRTVLFISQTSTAALMTTTNMVGWLDTGAKNRVRKLSPKPHNWQPKQCYQMAQRLVILNHWLWIWRMLDRLLPALMNGSQRR